MGAQVHAFSMLHNKLLYTTCSNYCCADQLRDHTCDSLLGKKDKLLTRCTTVCCLNPKLPHNPTCTRLH